MTIDLDRLNTEELGRLFPVFISAPDPEWIKHFEIEKKEIEKSLGPENIISINHIGSTVVPDLPAKPTIDILVEVAEEAENEFIIQGLTDLGYHFIPRPENPPPHMMFVKGYSEMGLKELSYHIHIRYKGDWDELFFRDYLRKYPEIAKQYAELKIQLSEIHRNDREAYTVAKTEFINRITQRARKEGQS